MKNCVKYTYMSCADRPSHSFISAGPTNRSTHQSICLSQHSWAYHLLITNGPVIHSSEDSPPLAHLDPSISYLKWAHHQLILFGPIIHSSQLGLSFAHHRLASHLLILTSWGATSVYLQHASRCFHSEKTVAI